MEQTVKTAEIPVRILRDGGDHSGGGNGNIWI